MEVVTPPLYSVNSIVNLNENNRSFTTGIDYVGGNKTPKEVTFPLIKNKIL